MRMGGVVGLSSFDAATNAWTAAVNNNAGTVTNARTIIVDTLVLGLKAQGLFSKLDRLWLFAAENPPSALTSLVNPSTGLATAVNSPTFTADQGYAGDAATSYINSGYNPSTGPQFTQDSAHYSHYARTDESGAVTTIPVGHYTGSTVTQFAYIAGISTGWVNDSVGNSTTFSNITKGLWMVRRPGANATALDKNGVLANSQSGSSQAPVNPVIYVGARNLSGVADSLYFRADCRRELRSRIQHNRQCKLLHSRQRLHDFHRSQRLLMLILDAATADQVRGLISPGNALAPRPLADGTFALPVSVLNDPAYETLWDFLIANADVMQDQNIRQGEPAYRRISSRPSSAPTGRKTRY